MSTLVVPELTMSIPVRRVVTDDGEFAVDGEAFTIVRTAELEKLKNRVMYIPAGASSRMILGEGRFVLDFIARRVYVRDVEAFLSPAEFNLLGVLVQAAGRPVSYQFLRDELVPNVSMVVFRRRLKMTVFSIRRKLETAVPGAGGLIIVRTGYGYELDEEWGR